MHVTCPLLRHAYSLTSITLPTKVTYLSTNPNTDLIMSMNNTKSCPSKHVGLFCYRCGRDDFGLNQKSLLAYVCYCSFNQYSRLRTKRKSDHHPSSLYPSGNSPYPLLVKKTRSFNNTSVKMADSYLNTNNDINVDANSEDS